MKKRSFSSANGHSQWPLPESAKKARIEPRDLYDQRHKIFEASGGWSPEDKAVVLHQSLHWMAKYHGPTLRHPITGEPHWYKTPKKRLLSQLLFNVLAQHNVMPTLEGFGADTDTMIHVIGTEVQRYYLGLIMTLASATILITNDEHELACLHCRRTAQNGILLTIPAEYGTQCKHPFNMNAVTGECETVWAHTENGDGELYASKPVRLNQGGTGGDQMKRVGQAVCIGCLYEHNIRKDAHLMTQLMTWAEFDRSSTRNGQIYLRADTGPANVTSSALCCCTVPGRIGKLCMFRFGHVVINDAIASTNTTRTGRLFDALTHNHILFADIMQEENNKATGAHHDFTGTDLLQVCQAFKAHSAYTIWDDGEMPPTESLVEIQRRLLGITYKMDVENNYYSNDEAGDDDVDEDNAGEPATTPSPNRTPAKQEVMFQATPAPVPPPVSSDVNALPPTPQEISTMNAGSLIALQRQASQWVKTFYQASEQLINIPRMDNPNLSAFPLVVHQPTVSGTVNFCDACSVAGHLPTKACAFAAKPSIKPRRDTTRAVHFAENIEGCIKNATDATRAYFQSSAAIVDSIVNETTDSHGKYLLGLPSKPFGPTPAYVNELFTPEVLRKGGASMSKLLPSTPLDTLASINLIHYASTLDLEIFFDMDYYAKAIPAWQKQGYDVSVLKHLHAWRSQQVNTSPAALTQSLYDKIQQLKNPSEYLAQPLPPSPVKSTASPMQPPAPRLEKKPHQTQAPNKKKHHIELSVEEIDNMDALSMELESDPTFFEYLARGAGV